MPNEPRSVRSIVELKRFIRDNCQGGCRLLSIGNNCPCPLCDFERIIDALRWYVQRAVDIAEGDKIVEKRAILELIEDGGKEGARVGFTIHPND